MLPDKTKKEVADFAANPSIEILENSSEAHVVRHKNLKVTGANFWEDEIKTVGVITCNKKASVMLFVNDDTLELSVSDPTHENNGDIDIKLSMPAKAIINADPGVTVVSLSPYIHICVNVEGSKGYPLKLKLKNI